jgi:Ala-tRNA(Pro) deacylase
MTVEPMSLQKSDELLAFLSKNGIEVKTFDHAPVHTVEESQKLRGDIPGLHTKNLFLRDGKKSYFLFVTDENASVEIKKLAKKIGARGGLSFGSAEALMAHLGIEPGSVSVLAAINDPERKVTIALDETLRSASTINCHPLTNTRTTSLSREALAAFLAATGHTPVYVSLAEDTQQ